MAFDTPHPQTTAATRIDEALAFDDVLLVPGYSQVLPSATDTRFGDGLPRRRSYKPRKPNSS